ncbi:uncharacterized protein [Lepisosteus oculatus]|uniref:uncharacterized protein isoform X2 n=1 Tax=Lepisosteus oculatus TaxID=7918 RepID=UPI0037169F19
MEAPPVPCRLTWRSPCFQRNPATTRSSQQPPEPRSRTCSGVPPSSVRAPSRPADRGPWTAPTGGPPEPAPRVPPLSTSLRGGAVVWLLPAARGSARPRGHRHRPTRREPPRQGTPLPNSWARREKASPCYVSFIRGAMLWDRGVYHNTHKASSSCPFRPCPRFLAHMKASPGSLRPPRLLSTTPKPPARPPVTGRGPALSTLRTGPVLNPKRGLHQTQKTAQSIPIQVPDKQPRSPAPSPASSEEDCGSSPAHVQEPAGACQSGGPPEADARAREEEQEEKTKEQEILWGGPDPADVHPSPGDVGPTRGGTSPTLSDAGGSLSSFSRPASSLFSRSTSLSSGRSSALSGLGSAGRGGSPVLSGLRSSSFSRAPGWAADVLPPSLGPGDPSRGSRRSRPSRRAAGPPGPGACAEGTRSQPGTPLSSAEETWPDLELRQWPVLPPISPQRDCSELGSHPSPDSDVQSAIFNELDALVPRTGSTVSLDHSDSFTGGRSSPDTELSKRTSSLTLGNGTEAESLSQVRLLLLDHRSWQEPHLDPSPLHRGDLLAGPAGCHAAFGNGVREQHKGLTFPGFPNCHTPAFPGEPKLVNTFASNGRDDQQSICTMVCSEAGSQPFSSPWSSTVSSPPCSPWVSEEDGGRDSASRDLCGKASEMVCREDELTKPAQQSHHEGAAGGVDRSVLGRREPSSGPGCVGMSERAAEGGRDWRRCRRRRPNQDLEEEEERRRRAEERKAKVLHIYTKLQENKSSVARAASSMCFSQFEDFDFLAKYCIFSPEKLAVFKRAFEVADNDRDGYLTCFQVLLALKEIIPPEALSDAEEIYVYRILEMVDYHITDGLTDLKLFAVMASLAQKITTLDDFMRSLIGTLDFKALELKLYKAKQLFLCNMDARTRTISAQQLLVELKAGGIREEHEQAVRRELRHIRSLDLLGFLTYLPLFLLIHSSVVANPLDDSKTL